MDYKISGLILDRVKAKGYVPETTGDFFGSLELDEEFFGLFNETIKILSDNFDIFLTKKGKIVSPESLSLYKGMFMSTAKKCGFVAVEGDFPDDFFIAQGNTKGAVSGDSVLVKIMAADDSRKRREAVVEKIISRARNKFLGVVGVKNGEYHVLSKAYGGVLPVWLEKNSLHADDKSDVAELGDIAEVEITKYPGEYAIDPKRTKRSRRSGRRYISPVKTEERAYGRITRVFGPHDSIYANYELILAEHNIRTEFSRRTIAEAVAAADINSLENADLRNIPADRLDLRDKLIFSIDGEDAKDLDDAISLELDADDNYILGVHIADVSHYVKQNGRVDREAYERGTSVYFADKVVPMLPVSLSNGICSLNAGEDRLAMSVFVTIDHATGKPISSSFSKSIINSKIRGVYSEINHIFETAESNPKYKPVMKILPKFRRLAKLLKKRRLKRGSLELSSVESVFIMEYDELLGESYPTEIKPRVSGEAEGMIEEFMLCANEAVAEYLNSLDYPCVYRVHEKPLEEKINAFLDTAREMGVYTSKATKKGNVNQKSLQTILDNSRESNLFPVINALLLRSMAKAKYSADCLGHYGLACDKYLHFTSPIRRYPDLTVHRILKFALDHNLSAAKKQAVKDIALKSSECEVQSIYAERSIEDLYKCVYMRRHIGEEFDGIIRGVTYFGFFVILENTCEGLVRIEDVGDNFEFDPSRYELRSGSRRFTVGDKVRVKVVAANVESQNVDFELVRRINES